MSNISGFMIMIFAGIFALVFLVYGAFLVFKKDDPDAPKVPKGGSFLVSLLKITGVIILGIVLVFAAIFFLARQGKVDESKAVWNECQAQIINVLKSPGSAKFQEFDPDIVHHYSDGSYGVDMWVDSQNSFGALVRTDFQCKIHKSGDQWVVDYNWQQR